jgi:hypothetical protein
MSDQGESDQIEAPVQVAPALFVWLAIVAALTLCAGMAGTGLGVGLRRTLPKETPNVLERLGEPGPAKYGGDTAIQALPAIITNLSGPEGSWVRVQASIVFDRKILKKPEAAAAEIGDDIAAWCQGGACPHSDGGRRYIPPC